MSDDIHGSNVHKPNIVINNLIKIEFVLHVPTDQSFGKISFLL